MLHDPGRTLGTQHALIDWVVAITLDITDLAVFQMDIDAASAGAHVASGLADFITYRLRQGKVWF